ncbi:hypothetical protein LXL04_013646 [Taraxacum kok-saghyz]
MALFFRKIEVKKVKMRMRSSVALMKPRRKMVLFLSEGDGLGVKAELHNITNNIDQQTQKTPIKTPHSKQREEPREYKITNCVGI